METLGEDILLLAIRPDGTLAAGGTIRFALAGSELVRLAALRRVDIVDGRIVVLSDAPTGDAFLDSALGSVRLSQKAPKAKTWVASAKTTVTSSYLARLEEAGVIRSQRSQFLKVFHSTRRQVLDVARTAELRARLTRIATSSGAVTTEDAAFAGLVYAVGLGTVLFPGKAGVGARRRLKEIAQRDKVARAVGTAAAGSVRGGSADASDAADAAVDASVHATVDGTVQAAVDAAVEAAVHAAVDAAVHAAVDAAHHAAASHGGHGDGGAAGGGHH